MSQQGHVSKDNRNKINSRSVVGSTKWMRLETIRYTDQAGKSRAWDMATRTTKSPGCVDAVVIIPVLRRKGSEDLLETILVEQFRPPIGNVSLEFPSGLVDDKESPEAAALRELKEETGFVGETTSSTATLLLKENTTTSRAVCMSAGLSDETVHIVLVHVDLDNPQNQDPQAQPDEGEYITTRRVSLKTGLIQNVLEQGNAMPNQGLYLFAMGLEMGLNLKKY